MLHVLVGELLTGADCTSVAEVPSEALADMWVCTALCWLRWTKLLERLSCCLPEHEGGHGPRTKLSRHRPLTVCMATKAHTLTSMMLHSNETLPRRG